MVISHMLLVTLLTQLCAGTYSACVIKVFVHKANVVYLFEIITYFVITISITDPEFRYHHIYDNMKIIKEKKF